MSSDERADDERADDERTGDEQLEEGATGKDAGAADDHRECELCGARVPAAVYREHVLKTCPGR